MPTGGWVSTPEAAEHLGITPRTLYRLIDHGDVSAFRIGRVIRLRLKDLDEYLEKCRIEPGALEHLYPSADTSDPEASSDEADEAD